MDLSGIQQKLLDGLHYFTTITGGLIVGVVALVVVFGATKFLKHDQRGTEEGKELLKGAAITLAVVAFAWLAANGISTYFSGLVG